MQDILRRYVHQTAKKEHCHPNKIWARLKKKYNFHSYKTLDYDKIDKIIKDLNIIKIEPSDMK